MAGAITDIEEFDSVERGHHIFKIVWIPLMKHFKSHG